MKFQGLKLLILFLLILVFNSCSQEIETEIHGEVIGWDSKELLLVPITENFSNITILQQGITIPVEDGKFNYTLNAKHIEAYMLIFMEEAKRHSYLIREFLNDTTVLKVTLYPDSLRIKNSFQGGELNNTMQKQRIESARKTNPLNASYESLYEANEMYTIEYQNLKNEISSTQDVEKRKQLIAKRDLLRENKEMYTPRGRQLIDKYESIRNQSKEWKKNYLRDNNNELAFVFLFQEFERMEELDPEMEENYKRISKIHPNHPYTTILAERIETLQSINVGGRYLDFTAPTIDGEEVKLSDKIDGQVALINLWSTWCGPCRSKNRRLIPVYEKYKNQGFIVLGVAGLYRNMEDYHLVMEKDELPWLNLIEMNNQNQIWFKYGISGNGGGTFLVDSTGEILAIEPTIDELDSLLNNIL